MTLLIQSGTLLTPDLRDLVIGIRDRPDEIVPISQTLAYVKDMVGEITHR